MQLPRSPIPLRLLMTTKLTHKRSNSMFTAVEVSLTRSKFTQRKGNIETVRRSQIREQKILQDAARRLEQRRREYEFWKQRCEWRNIWSFTEWLYSLADRISSFFFHSAVCPACCRPLEYCNSSWG
jgi:hypothetical protein